MYNHNNLPPIDTAFGMESEELAPFVLKDSSGSQSINRYNYTLPNSSVIQSVGNKKEELLRDRLMEAWMCLKKNYSLLRSRENKTHGYS